VTSIEPQPPDRLRIISLGLAYLAVSIAVLVAAPPANWAGGRWPQWEQFALSWTAPPTWHDGDPWTTNFVGHPIMGALLYSFARHGRASMGRAFVFATVSSLAWEYLIESWFEQPSWTDLLVTSTAGALLGELRWRARVRLIAGARAGRRWPLAAIAPVHALWLARGRH
jgi:hypothetical protein